MPKVTHVELDVLFVRVYDAIAHFYNGEKAVLDIMDLLKIDPGYYTTKCCGSLNMRRKLSSIYRFLEQRRKKWLYEVNLAAMKSACVALTYHIGYHNNCIKSADTWCQYQKDKQDNNYYKSKCNLPIDVRRAILSIYQSLCKSEML